MSLIRKHTDVEPVETAPTTPAHSIFDWPTSWTNLFDWFDQALPRVEQRDEEGVHVVRAEMPGIDPDEDLDITIANGVLHIKAERHEEETTDGKTYRSEFRYGSFVRNLALPAGASEDDVKATYQDGILEIRIPVSTEQAAARKVPVGRT